MISEEREGRCRGGVFCEDDIIDFVDKDVTRDDDCGEEERLW